MGKFRPPAGAEDAAVSALKTELVPPRRARRAVSGGDDLGAAELAQRVAQTLREQRRSRGLSLDDLAGVSGVSRASLSQIETLKTNPSLSVLWKIASGLQIPFSELLSEGTPSVGLLRRDDAQVLRSIDGRMTSRPIFPAGFSRDIEVYELKLLGRSRHASDAHSPGTRELVVVLAGVLRMHIGEDQHELGLGDSLVFPADSPHVYENPGGSEARYHNVILYAR